MFNFTILSAATKFVYQVYLSCFIWLPKVSN